MKFYAKKKLTSKSAKMHKESKRKRKFYISTLLAKVVVIKIYPTPFLKQSNWLKKRRYTVVKMKPGYEKNTVIIGCFFHRDVDRFTSREKLNSITM